VTGTPEEFTALIRAELERYGKLIRDAKISAQ
jgi:tripartite-type tricarboxylate transporter receptor subunit TctC